MKSFSESEIEPIIFCFQQLYDFSKSNAGIVEILRRFHDVLDAKRSFGSRRNAEYAAESLSMVLRDNGDMDGVGTRV